MSAARDRLKNGHYNSLEKTVDNPGGMADYGHRTNFPLALQDVGNVAQEIVENNDATLAAVVADNNATEAAIAANNTATVTAIVNDNDATQAAIGVIGDAAAGSAAAALAYKNAAATSETNAGNSATSSAASAATALRVVTANFPDRLDATGAYFSEAVTGDPAAIASAPGGKLTNVAGFGYVYQAAGAATLAHKGVMTAGSEYVIEIAVEVEQTVIGGGETPAARIRLQGLDRDYASTGAAATGPLVVTPIGSTIITRRFAYVAPAGGTAWPQAGVAVWLRPAVDINRKSDDSGAAAGSTARVRRISVRDVTAVVAAELAAAAAATSANSVALASQADAEAGSGPGLMSATRVGQAIAKLAVPVGGLSRSVTSLGSRFLKCDGASYLKASYPDLAVLCADRYASYVISSQGSAGVAGYIAACADTNRSIAVGGNAFFTSTAAGANTNGTFPNISTAWGVIKAATKYFAHGSSGSDTVTPGIYTSADGVAWNSAAATSPSFSGGSYLITAMAYGGVGGTNYLLAMGGGSSAANYLAFSTDEGANWSYRGSALYSSSTFTPGQVKLLVANNVVVSWHASLGGQYATSGASSFATFTPLGLASNPVSIDVGNSLFVAVLSDGSIWTCTTPASWTQRTPPPGFEGATGYLGYFNGEHLFAATVLGRFRVYGTPDFIDWRNVTVPASLSALVPLRGPFRQVSATRAAWAGAIMTFAHNPSTEFAVPNVQGDVPTYIRAL